MFRGKRELSSADKRVESYIGKGTEIRGDIVASGSVRIDGTVEGSIDAERNVTVGEGGKVAAEVSGVNVVVAGELTGNVKASGRLEIASTGRVYGDVVVTSLAVEDGAVFLGRCEMSENRKALEVSTPEPPDAGERT